MSVFSRVFGSGGGKAGGGGGGGGGAAGGGNKKNLQETLAAEKEHIDLLNQKLEHIQTRRMEQLKTAKKLRDAAKGNKTLEAKAVPYLRRAKMLEKQISQIQGQVDNLEGMVFSLENAAITKGTAEQMSSWKAAMASTGLDIDKVQDDMDDVREKMSDFEMITDAMSAPMMGTTVDDDELEAQLDELGTEDLEGELAAADEEPLDLPAVPTTAMPKAPAAKAKETDEMAELAAWAN